MGLFDFFRSEKKYPWPKNEIIENFGRQDFEDLPAQVIKTREIALRYVKSAENKNTNDKKKIFTSSLNPKTVYIAYSYYDNGNPNVIFCARLKNGKVTRPVIQHGYAFSFYDDTQYKMSSNYVNGKLDGMQVWYYPNGFVKSIYNFDNDEFHGINYWFHENEKLKQTLNFNKGVLYGKACAYHDNGKIHIEGQFENDLAEGEWSIYDSEGKLISSVSFEKGKDINVDTNNDLKINVDANYNLKIDLSSIPDSPIKSIDDLNLDEEKRKQLESMTIYADEDGFIHKNKFKYNYEDVRKLKVQLQKRKPKIRYEMGWDNYFVVQLKDNVIADELQLIECDGDDETVKLAMSEFVDFSEEIAPDQNKKFYKGRITLFETRIQNHDSLIALIDNFLEETNEFSYDDFTNWYLDYSADNIFMGEPSKLLVGKTNISADKFFSFAKTQFGGYETIHKMDIYIE